jgi:sterol desaturase/sphingolipid hydroxylase (fatty acid hydroxylase superfamily)
MFGTEDLIRAGIALAVFAAMALWEWAAPRRAQSNPRRSRWPGNLALGIVNAILVRVITPVTVLGVAIVAQTRGWGLANSIDVPDVVVACTTFVALDLVIYGQHVAFHRLGVLWRFHRVHHADLEFDVTTGVRFHPGEALISLAVKICAVLALGVPPTVVIVFEVVLNATSMFNHGNVRLPLVLDALLRTVFVTPDMHRVHHSRRGAEMNSNFGFNFAWWDRLFATYRAQPAAGHRDMELGLDQFRGDVELGLGHMLTQPWRAPGIPVTK